MHDAENEFTHSPHGSRLSHLHRSSMALLSVQGLCTGNPRFFCPLIVMAPHRALNTCWNNFLKTYVSKYHSKYLCGVHESARTCVCVRKEREGGYLRAGQGWFVLSAKCQSVFARLSHMISLNTQGLVVHLVGSWALIPPPPPLTPTTASPGLEVLPFYLPLRGYEKTDKAFHSLLLLSDFWISVILKWLQHVYSGLVAP